MNTAKHTSFIYSETFLQHKTYIFSFFKTEFSVIITIIDSSISRNIKFHIYNSIHAPLLHFSPLLNLVISRPLTPQVPIPTRPFTFSGVANILFLITPFFEDYIKKYNKLII